jgi:phage gpG-like protein
MDNKNLLKPLEQIIKQLQAAMPRVPTIVGNEVVNFALDNFERQGFLGNSFEAWRPRKNPNKWGQAPKRNSRPILIGIGTAYLKKSIRVISANMEEVVVGSDVPYAKAHNEGSRATVKQTVQPFTRKKMSKKVGIIKNVSLKTKTNITWGKYQTGNREVQGFSRTIKQNLPKRQFLGDSPYLRQKITREVAAFLIKKIKP